MNTKLNKLDAARAIDLAHLRAAAYRYDSDTVGAPDSASSEAHYAAFNDYFYAANTALAAERIADAAVAALDASERIAAALDAALDAYESAGGLPNE